MELLIVSLGWAVVVATLIVRAARQYGAYEQLAPEPGGADGDDWPRVDVIVPARDEGHNIGACLEGLVAQAYPAERLRVVVVDDRSGDDTAAVVRGIAADHGCVRLIRGEPLPAGWKGKPFACWQGVRGSAREADAFAGAWICFIDADTRAAPALLGAAVATARRRGIDMLSLEPFQLLGSFWERLLIPAGFYLLAFTQDLRRVNDPDRGDATANGQFILIRREVYEQVGGHAAVRSAIAEDSALARRVKRGGYRVGVIGAERLLATRMYHGLSDLWEGVSKNLIEMVGGGGKTAFFAAAGVVLAVTSLALPAICWWHLFAAGATPAGIASAALATAGTLALLGLHIGGAVYLRIPFWYGLLFPLAYLVGAALACGSLRDRARGRVSWKGRTYASSGVE